MRKPILAMKLWTIVESKVGIRLAGAIVACLLASCLLSGCSSMELNERAFVLGIALDIAESGELALSAQLYDPKLGASESVAQGSSYNITSTGATLGEATRDMLLQIGRKLQWGHTQMLLISDKLAKSDMFGEVLDFFYRDDEPRMTIRLSITQGEAAPYLSVKTFSENSIARQMRNIENNAHRFSGKTGEMNLFLLGRELMEEVPVVTVPYVRMQQGKQSKLIYKGSAIIANGKLAGLLTAEENQSYLMLSGRFHNGYVLHPCSEGRSYDTVELTAIKATEKVTIKENKVDVHYKVRGIGSVRELNCSPLTTAEESLAFQAKLEQVMQAQFEQLIATIKKRKIDLLKVGNNLYHYHPRDWQRLKPDWESRLAGITYSFDVEVTLINSGTEDGQPIFGRNKK